MLDTIWGELRPPKNTYKSHVFLTISSEHVCVKSCVEGAFDCSIFRGVGSSSPASTSGLTHSPHHDDEIDQGLTLMSTMAILLLTLLLFCLFFVSFFHSLAHSLSCEVFVFDGHAGMRHHHRSLSLLSSLLCLCLSLSPSFSLPSSLFPLDALGILSLLSLLEGRSRVSNWRRYAEPPLSFLCSVFSVVFSSFSLSLRFRFFRFFLLFFLLFLFFSFSSPVSLWDPRSGVPPAPRFHPQARTCSYIRDNNDGFQNAMIPRAWVVKGPIFPLFL